MRVKSLVPLSLLLTQPLVGQVPAVPVIDFSVLAQVIEDVRLATEQLDQLRTEVKRLGDPAAVKLEAARDLMRNLGMTGLGQTLEDIRALATGNDALRYDGNGLYRPPGEVMTTADGIQVPRAIGEYRKFDAVTRAKTTLEDVMRDTEERRQQLRGQIQTTLGQLRSATTVSEVQKLLGVLTAQNAELAAIDREREAALSRVVVQHIENQTDAAKQAVAEREERAAAFSVAHEKLSQFLTPNTSPIRIPDPRTIKP